MHRCRPYQPLMLKGQPSSNRLPLVGGNFSMDIFLKCGQTSKTSTSEISNFTLNAQMEHPGLNKSSN
eukprot:6925479-Ditylum_brightwellii.AAC.1